ncbi:TonB-dependent receptor [Kordiimonas sediminis]|uniref:TonB-dependent receptor n=2 Tax=Kordiimonas sediminis TaxID=1735581 RepID=A0A919AMI6_9PROT|nr:TonB-dependent receptor [Kordiimonas sediminis]
MAGVLPAFATSSEAAPVAESAPEPAAAPQIRQVERINATIFTIEAQPLASALVEFAQETGIGIIVSSDLISGIAAPDVEVTDRVFAALERMLEGSGLQYQRIGSSTVTLVPKTNKVRSNSAPSPGRSLIPVAVSNQPIEELLILGQRRPQYIAPQGMPVSDLGGRALADAGGLTAAKALLGLPMIEASLSPENSAALTNATGLSLVELRGLGSNRTLVLFNGRRPTSTIAGYESLQGLDLNGVSIDDIDRIEIIRGNMAAEYGSEAIGGVINFVLDRYPDGLTVRARGGLSEKGDGAYHNSSLKYGAGFADGAGQFNFSFNYGHSDRVLLSDRDITANPGGFNDSGEFVAGNGGSSFGQSGQLVGYTGEDGIFKHFSGGQFIYVKPDGSGVEPFAGTPEQKYNYTVFQNLIAPVDQFSGRLYSDYQFDNNAVVRLEAGHSVTKVNSVMAPGILGPSIDYLPLNHPVYRINIDSDVLSDDVRAFLLEASGGEAESVSIMRRLVEVGPRIQDIKRNQSYLNLSLEGSFDRQWTYGLYLQYGKSTLRNVHSGLFSLKKLLTATNPDACSVTQGCVPITLFGPGGISAEGAKYITAEDRVNHAYAKQYLAEATLEGNLDLLGRPFTVRGGVEYRSQSIRDQINDDKDFLGFPYVAVPFSGSVERVSSYGSLSWLVAEDLPAVKSLMIRSAARVDNQSGNMTNLSYSQALDWQPVQGMALVASFQESRRQPLMAELYTTSTAVNLTFDDPCSRFHMSNNPILVENCRAVLPDDVEDGFVQNYSDIPALTEGNSELEAEKVRSFSVGVDLSSDLFWRNRSVSAKFSADYYNTRIRDAITQASFYEVLSLCYTSKNLSHPYCGTSPNSGAGVIERDPVTGQLSGITRMPLAAGYFAVEGLETEVSLTYQPTAPSGIFKDLRSVQMTFMHHYLLKAEGTTSKSDTGMANITPQVLQYKGTVSMPKHRLYARLDASFSDWGVSARLSGRGSATATYSTHGMDSARVPWVFYTDVGFWYRLSDKIGFEAGVQNLFDKAPPFFAYSSASSTSPEIYDVIGRRFSAGITVKF